mmetsp:Transcript_48022/g.89921  ORF Transcript_48022/g.89921 Transcript_48022/m.89921 type:complete len:217 (+) Transcript_48022:573-1223(+)
MCSAQTSKFRAAPRRRCPRRSRRSAGSSTCRRARTATARCTTARAPPSNTSSDPPSRRSRPATRIHQAAWGCPTPASQSTRAPLATLRPRPLPLLLPPLPPQVLARPLRPHRRHSPLQVRMLEQSHPCPRTQALTRELTAAHWKDVACLPLCHSATAALSARMAAAVVRTTVLHAGADAAAITEQAAAATAERPSLWTCCRTRRPQSSAPCRVQHS